MRIIKEDIDDMIIFEDEDGNRYKMDASSGSLVPYNDSSEQSGSSGQGQQGQQGDSSEQSGSYGQGQQGQQGDSSEQSGSSGQGQQGQQGDSSEQSGSSGQGQQGQQGDSSEQSGSSGQGSNIDRETQKISKWLDDNLGAVVTKLSDMDEYELDSFFRGMHSSANSDMLSGVSQERTEQERRERNRQLLSELGKSVGTYDEFISDILRYSKGAIQPSGAHVNSANTIHPRNYFGSGTGIVQSGRIKTTSYNFPKFKMYIDASGSWGGDNLKKALDVGSKILELDKKRRLQVDVKFFATKVYDDLRSAVSDGGTALKPVVDDIMASNDDLLSKNKYTDFVIFTDADSTNEKALLDMVPATVDGNVWIVWKSADSKSIALMKAIHGSKRTRYYALDSMN